MLGLTKKFVVIGLMVLLPLKVLAYENLDEIETRSARKSSATYYSGENPDNHYMWQPQTLIYQDDSTGHEVIIWSQVPNIQVNHNALEYGWLPWSADGKRMAWHMNLATAAYTTRYGYPWFIARADGSKIRPFLEGPARTSYRQPYFDWSRAVADTAHQLGYNQSGRTGLDQDTVYRVTVTDTGGSFQSLIDLGSSGSRVFNSMKGAVTSDGKYQVFSLDPGIAEQAPFHFVDIVSGTLVNAWGITDLNLDTYWTGTSINDHLHDEFFIGNSATGYWLEFYWSSPNACHWRAKMSGSDDGIPTYTHDTTAPYDWYAGSASQTEVQPLGGYISVTRPWSWNGYWSHHAWDAWGTSVAFNDGDQQCPSWHSGLTVSHMKTESQNYACGANTYQSYAAWGGFTDFALGAGSSDLGAMRYNSDSVNFVVLNHHSSVSGEFVKPGQSPDGTKGAVHTDWLTSGTRNLLIGVVYYPHAPEIVSSAASNEIVSIEFNWRTDQETSRGYTQRGWPDEDADDPPPPRETELFRLWRSSDKATWIPLNTVEADIFDRYDFSDGVWESGYDASSTWRISDRPGDGTWYYAVTSKEWSGLESRSLSNIYAITVFNGSGTGSQDGDYPSDPGDLNDIDRSDFYTSFNPLNPSLIRGYNIYANDGSPPSVQQQDLIATVPVGSCSEGTCHWVDWLGATDETTQYIVAALDTQGNVSGPIYVTRQTYTSCENNDCSAVSPTPAAQGQYLLMWDDMYGESTGDGHKPASPTGLRILNNDIRIYIQN